MSRLGRERGGSNNGEGGERGRATLGGVASATRDNQFRAAEFSRAPTEISRRARLAPTRVVRAYTRLLSTCPVGHFLKRLRFFFIFTLRSMMIF